MLFNRGVTHLGSEASIYQYVNCPYLFYPQLNEEDEDNSDKISMLANLIKSNNPMMVCPFCSENFAKENLFQHLNEEHSHKISFNCIKCECYVTGGFEEFLFHLTAFHPKVPLNEGFGCLKILKSPKERRLILEKNNKMITRIERTLTTVFCPFCGIPINFKMKGAFLMHIKILHEKEIHRFLSLKSMTFNAMEMPLKKTDIPTSSQEGISVNKPDQGQSQIPQEEEEEEDDSSDIDDLLSSDNESTPKKKLTRKRAGNTYRQSGILERFSKVLPNSNFRNGGIKKNWSNIFIVFC